jgi:DNA polymerase III sliding clamp (beta) subunit (PCNA family)
MKTIHNLTGFTGLTSKDELKPGLAGVYLNVKKSELCATDGHVLGVAKVIVEDDDSTAILPADALKYKSGTAKRPKEVTWEVNGKVKRTELEIGSGEESSFGFQPIQERFPDYEMVLPWNGKTDPVFEIGVDLTLLARIAKAIPCNDKSVKLTFRDPLGAIEITPIPDPDTASNSLHIDNQPKEVRENYRFLVMPRRMVS